MNSNWMKAGLFLAVVMAGAPVFAVTYTFDATMEGWTNNAHITGAGIVTQALQFGYTNPGGFDPILVGPTPGTLTINASVERVLVIDVTLTTVDSGNTAPIGFQFFFGTVANPGLSEAKSVHFNVTPNAGRQSIAVDLYQLNANWRGTVNQIRLDPGQDPARLVGGLCRIHFLSLNAGLDFQFNTAGDLENWSIHNQISTLTVSGGALRATFPNTGLSDPHMGVTPTFFNASAFRYIKIRQDATGHTGSDFLGGEIHAFPGSLGASFVRKGWGFYPNAGNNTIILDMGTNLAGSNPVNNQWLGTDGPITSWRIDNTTDPLSNWQPSGQIAYDFISVTQNPAVAGPYLWNFSGSGPGTWRKPEHAPYSGSVLTIGSGLGTVTGSGTLAIANYDLALDVAHRFLVLDMNVSTTAARNDFQVQLFWANDGSGFDNSRRRIYTFNTNIGMNRHVFDLNTVGSGAGTWSGFPHGLLLQLGAGEAGVNSIAFDNIELRSAAPPQIAEIADAVITDSTPYSVTPSLVIGQTPVTWSKIAGPASLTVNPGSGQVNWASPTIAESGTVTIRATNAQGSDDESWTITVNATPPIIAPIANQAKRNGQVVAVNAATTQGTGPITWSIVTPASPPGDMAIHPSTGVFTWTANHAVGPVVDVVIRATGAQSLTDTEDFSITVALPVTIATHPVGGTRTPFPPANSIDFTVAGASGLPPYSYEWYFDNGGGPVLINNGARPSGATASGATTATLSLTGLQLADTGDYFAIVFDSISGGIGDLGSFAQSNDAALLVTNDVIILTDPAGGMFYTGENHTLSVVFSGGTGPYQFNWTKDSFPAAGAPNAATWVRNGLVPGDSGIYACQVVDLGPGGTSATSVDAVLQVANPVIITTHPVTRIAATGSTQNFTVASTGGFPPVAYQWEFDDALPGGFVPLSDFKAAGISGANGTTLTLDTIAQSDEGAYRCVVTDARGGAVAGSSATSNAANMTVYDSIIISQHPQDVSGWPAAGAAFSVVLSSGESVTYAWQFSFNGLSWTDLPASPTIYTGINTSTLTFLTPVAPFAEGFYRLRMNNPLTGAGAANSIISNAAQLSLFDPAAITQHPQDQSSYPGNPLPVSFSVTAAGGGTLFYQWQRNPGTGFVDLAEGAKYVGVATNTLQVANTVPADSVPYRCRVTSDDPGNPPAIFSNSATINFVDPAIISQPVSQTVNPGVNVSFSVSAASATPLNYQWQYFDGGWVALSDGSTGNGSTISGSFAGNVPTSTLQISNVREGDEGRYRCVVESGGPNSPQISNEAILTVNDPPTITTHPQGQAPEQFDTFMLSVAATGPAPISFQWQFDPDSAPGGFLPLNDGGLGGTAGIVSGPGTSVLTITGADNTVHNGSYRVVVSNGAGSVTSNAAVVTVTNAPPSIVTHPQDIVVPIGGGGSVSVSAVGSPVLMYQWQYAPAVGGPYLPLGEGVNGWTGVATPTLSFANASQAFNEGYVRCVVTNSGPPPATSNPAFILVGDPLAITLQPVGVTEYVDGPVFPLTIATFGGRGTQVVEWFRNNVAVPSSNTLSLPVNPMSLTAGAHTYRATVNDDRNRPVTSIDAVVNIVNHLGAPIISPNPAVARPGRDFTFSVTVTGGLGSRTFQWLRDDGAKALQPIPGATGSSFTIPNVGDDDAGFYAVTVSDSGSDVVTSDPIELVLGEPLPAVGLLGLTALITALGGAAALRRRLRL